MDNQTLLEQSAQAFMEPLYSTDGSIQSKWVSKALTQQEYKRANHWRYRAIKKDGRRVVVAFRLPTHLINPQTVTELSSGEIVAFGLDN